MKGSSALPGMPILSAGRHRSAKQGACFMEYASYLAGERWSDHPACTHPLLAALARDVNDLTSEANRARLTPLIHRVVGLTSDDPQVTALIAAHAAAAAIPVANLERQRALAAGLLNLVTSDRSERTASLARSAFQAAPDAERWARLYLASSAVPGVFTPRAASAIVHTAIVGIALACVDGPDDLLLALLTDAIEATEAATRYSAAVMDAINHTPSVLTSS